jgi:ribosomal-protein-alanine N-acetyltransferase
VNLIATSMSMADIDDVVEIERLSFATPWSRDAFEDELARNNMASYLVVRDEHGRAVAYGGQWVILDEAHITNIAVHPDFRRRGIGHKLMVALMCQALARGARRMTLEVRVSNLAAQALYAQLGFRPSGVRRGYYMDTGEDALVMWLDDIDAAVRRRMRDGDAEGSEEISAGKTPLEDCSDEG